MRQDIFPVPNICRNSNVLVVILTVELLSLGITLALYEQSFVAYLGVTSLYLQWWALSALFLLCRSRTLIAQLPRWSGALLAAFLMLSPFVIIELFYQYFFQHPAALRLYDYDRLMRLSGVALLAVLVLLRLMVLMSRVERWNKAEAESRIQALQSRIQPHFLFNSLNTISELAATDSDKAEEAIQALSMLFRIGLEQGNNFHSLDRELSLCKRYVELEMWRVGEFVEVKWDVAVNSPEQHLVPKLILQPLIENAIKYSNSGGSEPMISVVEVSIKETGKYVSIKIANTVFEALLENSAGNGIAIENIKERLFVLYDDRYSFSVSNTGERYQVLMKLPKQYN